MGTACRILVFVGAFGLVEQARGAPLARIRGVPLGFLPGGPDALVLVTGVAAGRRTRLLRTEIRRTASGWSVGAAVPMGPVPMQLGLCVSTLDANGRLWLLGPDASAEVDPELSMYRVGRFVELSQRRILGSWKIRLTRGSDANVVGMVRIRRTLWVYGGDHVSANEASELPWLLKLRFVRHVPRVSRKTYPPGRVRDRRPLEEGDIQDDIYNYGRLFALDPRAKLLFGGWGSGGANEHLGVGRLAGRRLTLVWPTEASALGQEHEFLGARRVGKRHVVVVTQQEETIRAVLLVAGGRRFEREVAHKFRGAAGVDWIGWWPHSPGSFGLLVSGVQGVRPVQEVLVCRTPLRGGRLSCRQAGQVSDSLEVDPRRGPLAAVGGAIFLAGLSDDKTELYVFGGVGAARAGQRAGRAAGTSARPGGGALPGGGKDARPAGGRSRDESRSYQGFGGK